MKYLSLTHVPRQRSILLAIILLAIILRIIVALYLGDSTPSAKDETSYSLLANRVANGFGYSFDEAWYPFTPAGTPTAHWSFLYTAVIAVIYGISGFHPLAVRIVSAIVAGVLMPLVVYRLSRRLLPDEKNLAMVTAGCAAIYAYFILYSAMLMTEMFFIIAVIWSLERAITLVDLLQERRSLSLGSVVGLGVSLGLATLLRQSILPWVVVLFTWVLWKGWHSQTVKMTVYSLLVVGLIIATFIIPFTLRNYRIYGDFLLLNSNAGYGLYSAQHPMHGKNFQPFTAAPLPDDIIPEPENEAQWDRALMQRGLEFIAEDPGRYALLSLSRVADYFMFWPSRDTSLINNIGRVASFGFFLPVMGYGLWISRSHWRRFQLLYLFILFYSLMHLLTWSMVRYRLPVDAVLIIFAALGLVDLASRSPFFEGQAWHLSK